MQERLISNQAKFQNYSEKSGGKASGKMTRKASENILSDQTEDYTFPRTFPSAFLTFWPFLGGRGRKWDFGFFVLFLLDNTSIGGPQVQWPTTPKNRKLKPGDIGELKKAGGEEESIVHPAAAFSLGQKIGPRWSTFIR